MAYDGFRGGYGVGVNNVGSYQVSGIPWVSASVTVPAHSDAEGGSKGTVSTGATTKIEFPYVTKFVTVRHDPTGSTYVIGNNNGIRVGFSAAGAVGGPNRNYFVLSGSESITLEIKTKEIYLVSCNDLVKEATVIAGLTNITSKLTLSGVENGVRFNYSGSDGIG